MKRRIFLLAAMIWMIVIYCFSAQNAAESGDLSGGLLEKFMRIFVPNWEQLSAAQQTAKLDAVHTIFRKCAHFTEYALLGILWTLAVRTGHWQRSKCPKWRIWLPFALSLVYAASDELHQKFVDGRGSSLRDVCIDFCGACTGILLLCLAAAVFRRLRQKHQMNKQIKNTAEA